MLRSKWKEPTTNPYADRRYEGTPVLAVLKGYVRWTVGKMGATGLKMICTRAGASSETDRLAPT